VTFPCCRYERTIFGFACERTRGAWIHACDTTVQYRFVSHCCDIILLCIISQISNKIRALSVCLSVCAYVCAYLVKSIGRNERFVLILIRSSTNRSKLKEHGLSATANLDRHRTSEHGWFHNVYFWRLIKIKQN